MRVRTKRKICAAISLFGFLFALGVVGGIEFSTMPLIRGTLLMLAGLLVFIGAAYKGGWVR